MGHFRELIFNNPIVAIVTASQLVRTLGRSVAWIFTPLFLVSHYHDSYFEVGFIFFLSALVSLPFSIYGGNLIDRIGRRIVSILSPLGSTALFAGLFMTSFIEIPEIIVYVLFVLVFPLADLEGIADNVIMTDSVAPAARTDAFSLARISANVGFSMGPSIGGFVATYGYGFTYVLPMVTSFSMALLYLFRMKETRPASSTEASRFSFPSKDREFLYFAVLVSFSWFVAGQWGTTLTLFLNNAYHFNTVQIGLLYSLNGIVVIVFQLPVNYLLKSLTEVSRLSLGVAIYAVTFFCFSLTTSFPLLLLDTAALTIGENTMAPASQTLIARLAPEAKRGEYFGAFGAIGGLIAPVAPLFGTFALGYLIMTPILFWSIFLYLGIGLAILLRVSGKISRRVD
jgi:MFS family permease